MLQNLIPPPDRFARLGMLTARWVTSVVIAYAFLVAVMTASAQQRVTAVLDQRADAVSYSSALTKVKAFEAAKKERDGLREEAAKRKADGRIKRAQLTRRELAVEDAWGQFTGTVSRARMVEGCVPTDLPSGSPDPQVRLAVWNAVIDCWRNDVGLSIALKRDIKAKAEAVPNYYGAYSAYQAAKSDVDDAQAEIGRVVEELAVKEKDVADAAELSATFDDTIVLRQSWFMLGVGAVLVDFPPSMLQILLAFVSGLFGALLVTLVLVVYPQAAFAGVSAGQEYHSRLLLGGLISVGAYVILGAGSAVLGNTNPFGQSQPNFMTFCAVGVLAGMFSDRVAGWLSDRANTFFKTGDATQDMPQGAAHTSDPAAPAAPESEA